jgi:excisionase family DNA binding protein
MGEKVESRVGIEPLITSGELCELLRIDRPRLYALLEAGVLKGVRLGRRWRFAPVEVRAFIESGGRGLPGGWRRVSERSDG